MPAVLVVEDDAAIAELIVVNLRHNGFHTAWAADSASAEQSLNAAVPDLILLDWMLPGETGLYLVRRWRSSSEFKDVPIVMLTARDAEVDRVAGLDAGADDFIAKPFSVRELLARMRAVLRRNAPELAQGRLAPTLVRSTSRPASLLGLQTASYCTENKVTPSQAISHIGALSQVVFRDSPSHDLAGLMCS